MTRIARTSYGALCLVILATLLAACSGSGSGSSDSLGGGNGGLGNTLPPPVAIEGIATPSSVSVVTATNAS